MAAAGTAQLLSRSGVGNQGPVLPLGDGLLVDPIAPGQDP
jgi:hypothetical protein